MPHLGSIAHTLFLKPQNISVALRETPLLFLLFGLLVKHLKVNPEGENHDDSQPVGRGANIVRVSVSRTPSFGSHVRAGDITQLTELINERDYHRSPRGWTRYGTNPPNAGDERSTHKYYCTDFNASDSALAMTGMTCLSSAGPGRVRCRITIHWRHRHDI